MKNKILTISVLIFISTFFLQFSQAQNSALIKYAATPTYAGIEVGSKGVKMSILEIGKNAKKQETLLY